MQQTIKIQEYFRVTDLLSDTIRELNLARNDIARLEAEQKEVVTEEESRAHNLELENSELKAELARLREAARHLEANWLEEHTERIRLEEQLKAANSKLETFKEVYLPEAE